MPNEPTVSPRPSGLLRLFFKMPALFYQIGFGSLLAKRMLLLITIGRRSGQRRVTALNYGMDGSTVYVLVGYGSRTDWYRNLSANPLVEVQIGSRRYTARARTVANREEAARAVKLVRESEHGPPSFIRPILKRLIGLDYEAEATRLFDHPEEILAVALEPSQEHH